MSRSSSGGQENPPQGRVGEARDSEGSAELLRRGPTLIDQVLDEPDDQKRRLDVLSDDVPDGREEPYSFDTVCGSGRCRCGPTLPSTWESP